MDPHTHTQFDNCFSVSSITSCPPPPQLFSHVCLFFLPNEGFLQINASFCTHSVCYLTRLVTIENGNYYCMHLNLRSLQFSKRQQCVRKRRENGSFEWRAIRVHRKRGGTRGSSWKNNGIIVALLYIFARPTTLFDRMRATFSPSRHYFQPVEQSIIRLPTHPSLFLLSIRGGRGRSLSLSLSARDPRRRRRRVETKLYG